MDEHQISKCYGFVTFQSEDDVWNVTEMGTLFLSNKKQKVGSAVTKQARTPVEQPELVVATHACLSLTNLSVSFVVNQEDNTYT